VFSSDGQRIVTASADKTARLWNAANGRPLATLQGHTDSVRSAVFSPDGQRIVTASDDRTARVWNAASGQLLASQGHTEGVMSAEFSPDGQRIVTASNYQTARRSAWKAVSRRSGDSKERWGVS
jgi:WD40 repeat protein